MRVKKRKVAKGLIVCAVVLVVIRLALPFVIKWYLNNKVLNDMNAYNGMVKDVDLNLLRGAYTIDSLKIVKNNTNLETPFVSVPEMDLSIQWKALFRGEIVGEVICFKPNLYFAFSKTDANAQTGAEEDWTEVVKGLIPIKINRFVIEDGQIALTNVLTQPSTDLPLESFNLEIRNIQNTENIVDSLPSSIVAEGTAPGYGGNLSFTAKAMLLKQVPDFDYDLKFEKVKLTSLNPLAKHYSGMDFEEGTISIYSEMAMKDQAFQGYIKPLVEDMKIFKWKEEDRPLGQWFREFFGEGIQELFENQKRQQFATRVPIKGALKEVNTDLWSTIFNAFKNAYIRAFEYKLDESINFKELQSKS